MKIGIIGSRGVPALMGGVEKVVEDLAKELTSRGHEVFVYCRKYYCGHLPEPAYANRIFTSGFSSVKLDALSHSFTAFRDAAKRKDFDLLHIHSPAPAIWSGLINSNKIPTVFTVHACDWNRKRWSWLARKIIKTGLVKGMKNASVVTAVSQEISARLSYEFDRSVRCVENMISPPAKCADNTILEMLGIVTDEYILHVGRLVEEKNLDLLLRAWSKIPTDKKLVVAGEFYDSRFADKCKALADDRVIWAGPVFGESLSALYQNCIGVAQPSSLEGASLVVLEAASYKKPVLCVDITANKLQLGDDAIYFACDCENSLVQALGELVKKSTKLIDIGQIAGDKILAKYSPANICEKYLEAYNQAIAITKK